jgi:hypothetical protein
MKIQLGKKEPTDIEKALLKALALGEVRFSSSKGYYLSNMSPKSFSHNDNTIKFNGEPIIHQQMDSSGNVEGFTLDINGICRCADPSWSMTSLETKKQKHDDAILVPQVNAHKELITNLIYFNQAMQSIKALQEGNPKTPLMYIGETDPANSQYRGTPMYSSYMQFSNELDKLRVAHQAIATIQRKIP